LPSRRNLSPVDVTPSNPQNAWALFIQARLAPLFRVLQGAAPHDPELDALWQGISQHWSRNMHLLAKDLAATGRLRQDLSVARAADIIWSMNSPSFICCWLNSAAGRPTCSSVGWATRGFGCY
jgi:hypothetical protein